jgi:hypothetical protein
MIENTDPAELGKFPALSKNTKPSHCRKRDATSIGDKPSNSGTRMIRSTLTPAANHGIPYLQAKNGKAVRLACFAFSRHVSILAIRS